MSLYPSACVILETTQRISIKLGYENLILVQYNFYFKTSSNRTSLMSLKCFIIVKDDA